MASSKWAGLGVFPPGTRGTGRITLAGLDLGSAGAPWNVSERLTALMMVLLTAVSTGCFSSALETVSSSSSGSMGPKGSRRVGSKRLGGATAVLSIGEHLAMLALILLTAILAGCLSSTSEKTSSSSRGSKGPKGSKGTEGRGTSNVGVVLSMGESRLVLRSFNSLMTFLVSSHHRTAFGKRRMDGA
jgi:hypothetical protein